MEVPLQRLKLRLDRAVKSAKKRDMREQIQRDLDLRFEVRNRVQANNRITRQMYKTEIKQRREEWEVGPRLMPRRDVGLQQTFYGTTDQNFMYPSKVPEKWRTEKWLAEGDRVVLLSGPDRGSIGVVTRIMEEEEHVLIKDLNRVDVEYPEWAQTEEGRKPQKVQTFPRSLPWSDVKLVFPMVGESGAYRDVVVERLELRKHVVRDGQNWKTKYKRFIPGVNVEIPWPAEPAQGGDKSYDSDTLRITVDESTFTPRLINSPMPPSIIDELRGKYSKLRSRHDPEYIAKLVRQHREGEAITAARDRRGMTPMQEQVEAYKAQKAAMPERDLSDAELAAIGKAIEESGEYDRIAELHAAKAQLEADRLEVERMNEARAENSRSLVESKQRLQECRDELDALEAEQRAARWQQQRKHEQSSRGAGRSSLSQRRANEEEPEGEREFEDEDAEFDSQPITEMRAKIGKLAASVKRLSKPGETTQVKFSNRRHGPLSKKRARESMAAEERALGER